jgi:low temperature requirement protein LtrA
MVAGIIVAAVGDELMLHHPGGHTDLKTAAVILAGPALYLVLLALLAPTSPALTPLALSAAANAVLIAVAIWEWISIGRKAEAMRSE